MGWLKRLVTTNWNSALTRSTILTFFVTHMSTFQYIRPRTAPTPPVPLSMPRMGLRTVLNTVSGFPDMLRQGPLVQSWTATPPEPAIPLLTELPPPYVFVEMHCS